MTDQKDSKKKKNGRRAYLNDFKLQDNGEYIYKGTVYRFKGDWKQCRKTLWTLCAVLAVLVIAGGLLPSAGMMNAFYVILPYLGEAVTAALLIYAVYKLTKGDGNIREYIYVKTFERFREYFMMLFIFSVMCLIGEILCLIITKNIGKLLFSVIFMILQVFVFGIASALNRHSQAMSFKKMKSE